MPGLVQRSAQFGNATAVLCSPSAAAIGSNGIWSKQRGDITSDQLQKFWSELPPHARQELLRIDKQTLFEQARKNLYCSRCNGLLLEGFQQIVMYGKSLQQDAGGMHLPNKSGAMKNQIDKELNDVQDPSVHPWGGLSATRDGSLTLLDCFLYGKSLRALQNVFDSARARERERELLYPDACGGGGRGWISQGIASYGRAHGTRETCALHTARLSCDTLVDFWSALGDETRLSLLRMKEEDFIERLMYRFDSKRFCRDCRRNVIREFKELKELKRMRREPRCTTWFCVADTAFQYEVSDDTVQADWHQSFMDTVGIYHHFEWAIGTGEGKSDILEFEDVGMNGKVQVNGLDLSGLSACFITLRAWRLDGRCTEFTVKAHALKGQPCVHRRLVVGDGYVTITKGESIRRFFEHAEEAEEEEDDDAIDKDGNELDGDGSRPQKHAKSPELAREFLLDAATVIFKEQVEKAFREGTARQNAHSIFVCLALKLLEERVHVACKEIITLEKQIKLLEEEEKEKREEEERKERRRTKEREKKIRRKERLKEKEREKETKVTESKSLSTASPTSLNESSMSTLDGPIRSLDSDESIGETGDIISSPLSPDIVDESLNGCVDSEIESTKNGNLQYSFVDVELNARDGSGSFILEQSKSSRRKLKSKKDSLVDIAYKWYDKRRSVIGYDGGFQHDESEKKLPGYMMVSSSSRCINGEHRQSRGNVLKTTTRNCGPKFGEKFHFSNNRMRDRYDFHSCSCNQHSDYRAKEGQHMSLTRSGREIKIANKMESPSDISRTLYRTGKYSHGCYVSDNSVITKGKLVTGNIHAGRGDVKQVWEPMDVRKKCPRSSSEPDVTSRTASKIDPTLEVGIEVVENGFEQPPIILKEPDDHCSLDLSSNSAKVDAFTLQTEEGCRNPGKSGNDCHNGFGMAPNSHYYSKKSADEEVDSHPISSAFSMGNACDPLTSSSSSDNCSSCLSEGDSSTSSSSVQNAETSSTSDSEDASQQSEGREGSTCIENALGTCQGDSTDDKRKTNGGCSITRWNTSEISVASCTEANFSSDEPMRTVQNSENGRLGYNMPPQQRHMLPIHNQSLHMPIFAPSTMGYHNQSPASWTAVPANGMVPFPQPHHFMFPSPLGYGLPTNQSPDFCLQFNALQPLTTPLLNVGQLPPYQTANKVHLNEQPKNLSTGGVQKVNGIAAAVGGSHPIERPFPTRQFSPKPQPAGENDSFGNNAKSHNGGSPSFSLFHYDVPMAVAAGYNLNSESLKEVRARDLPPSIPEVKSDHSCPQKEIAVEEYSLFASKNGAGFSFF